MVHRIGESTTIDGGPLADEPMPPRRSRYRVEEEGDLLRLRLRRARWMLGPVAFLLAWETLWTFGCVRLLQVAWKEPTLEHVLFAIPFLTAWVGVAAILVYLMLGFETLEVGPDGLEYRWGLLGLVLGRRRVARGELKGARSYHAVVEGDQSSSIQYGVKVETSGRMLRFGQGMDQDDARWLAGRIDRHLRALGPVAARPDGDLPSDSTLRRIDRWDCVEVRRSRLDPAALGSVTLICLFWNGIVGVFVLQLVRQFQWFLFLFLIPFELIGLALFMAWLGLLAAPMTVRRWVLDSQEIRSGVSFLGLGRTRCLDVADLARVDFRKGAKTDKRAVRFTYGVSTEEDCPFAVALVDHHGLDRLVIDRLTEGEARWLHREFCVVYMGVLARPSPPAVATLESLWDREIDG